MRPEFIKEIKEKLQAEKDSLERQLAEFAAQNPKNAEDQVALFPNLGDKDDENAEEVDAYSTNLTLERTLESNLRDVTAALKKIADDEYGICKYCGKEIDEKRLLARPGSSSCISCKKSFTQEM